MPGNQDFHQLSIEQTAARLQTDAERGLTAAEARARLDRYGPNELEQAPETPAWRRFLRQFQDALVLLLVAAAAVSWAVWAIERESALPYEALVILAIVILNAVLGFVQEERAEKALAALREMSAAEAKVLREGRKLLVPARDIVPGDLLLIEEGDQIAADARLVEVVELRTLEASLTGESLPVQKSVEPVREDAALGDRRNMVFAGTTAGYGRGRAVAAATGMRSELGRIAGMMARAEPESTPLQRELDRTGRRLGLAVVVIAVVMVATLLAAREVHDVHTAVDTLLFGVALAVAAVPEGLAAVVTVVLALGVQRMARRGAIVRQLPAVETLGSATVIASDKTGTLTRNEMTVRVMATAGGRPAPEGEAGRLLRAASLANNAAVVAGGDGWSILGDPTEGALVVAARKAGLDGDALEREFPRLRELPFSSERKRMSTVHSDRAGGAPVLFAKGAPDVLLELCTEELVQDEPRPLTPERRAEILEINQAMTGEALRTLGVAFRPLAAGYDWAAASGEELESELVFLGLAGMIDPPRAEAAEAVSRARGAGIRPIMITGDHAGTALAIARELEIEAGGGVLTGADLERLDEAGFQAAVARCSVYARVNPGHKMRIVDALQAQGAVVAMTGDGVNDAPALKSADIGVAMGITGTDVSKEAADIVLTDDNFATIVAAVEEGRAIFDNIRKFLRYLLSSNVGEVLTIFLAVLFAEPLGLTEQGLPILPLLATQVLWINLITDGPPALALGFDPPAAGLMKRRPRPPGESVITASMWWSVGLVGLVMALGTVLVLDASLPGGLVEGSAGARHGRTMAFTTLVLFQLFNAFNARSAGESAFRGMLKNRRLLAAVGFSLALQLLPVYVPFFQQAFRTVPLSLADWGVCALAASSVLWVLELWKLALRARLGRMAQ